MGALVVIAILILASGSAFALESSSSVDSSSSPNNANDLLSTTISDLEDAFGMSTKLSAAEIAVYAQNAGFQGGDLTTAVAVALAESGGKISSYNPVTNLDSGRPTDTPVGKGAIGLWQIYLKVHPEFAGWDLTDPQQNANAAFSVYHAAGRSFRPWTTFRTGRYEAYLPAAQDAVNA